MCHQKRIYITGMATCLKKYGEDFGDLTENLPDSMARRMDSFSLMIMQGALTALTDAGFDNMEEQKCGAVFNTYWGPLRSTETFFLSLIRDGADNVPPSLFPSLVTNASLGKICKIFRILNSTSFLIATSPLEYAVQLMKERENQFMVIGECDELFETNLSACISAGVLDRDGVTFANTKTVCAGGYSAFILQKMDTRSDYKGKVYAEVLASANIYAPMVINQLAPDTAADRFVLAAERAMKEALITAEEIGGVVSFSNGCDEIEKIDKTAMIKLFGGYVEHIKIVRPKYEMGEFFGEGFSVAIKAGIELMHTVGDCAKVIMCCSYTAGNNINVTLIR